MNPVDPNSSPEGQPQILDVPTAISQRRSIKSFQSQPIAPEVLRKLIELAVAAPSSYNLQDWRLVIIQDEAQKLLTDNSKSFRLL
jgi:nitroreductase